MRLINRFLVNSGGSLIYRKRCPNSYLCKYFKMVGRKLKELEQSPGFFLNFAENLKTRSDIIDD
jgi:hypothetical protein